MRLEGKIGIVYGAAGSMGSAVTRAFADAGAGVHLAGRSRAKLERLAGGLATDAVLGVDEVDVDDGDAVHRHADKVVERFGRIDFSFNAVGMGDVQGIPLHQMRLDDFMCPVTQAMRRHFNTATASVKHMIPNRSGVIVLLTSSAAREWRHLMGGFSVACASIEALNRTLAGELAGTGVRTMCIRANFTPETADEAIPPEALHALVKDTLVPRLPRRTAAVPRRRIAAAAPGIHFASGQLRAAQTLHHPRLDTRRQPHHIFRGAARRRRL